MDRLSFLGYIWLRERRVGGWRDLRSPPGFGYLGVAAGDDGSDSFMREPFERYFVGKLDAPSKR